ncbi:MAG: hypothetical protein HY678_10390 [Chloroflexi bacterium]|nr:hypothetical protein [Chloroflexota bacterium]
MKLFFIGAGAIGSYLGGFLSRAGHDVTIVDPWPEQVEAIDRQGISVSGPHAPFVARPKALHVYEAQRLAPEFEIAFIAMKSYDTAWATRFAMRFIRPDGYVVSAQNCWNDPVIASIVGTGRAVGLIMSRISVAVWEPGKVERGVEKGASTGYYVFRAGEHDGRITLRVQELAKVLSVIDAAQATDNLWGERWAKLSQNSMGNAVQAMSGLGTLEIASMPRGRQITILLASESAKTGLRLGYKVPKFGAAAAETWAQADRGDVFEELNAMLTPKESLGRNWRASMAQDVIKGRRSEIDHMNGFVARKAREAGVPAPVSEATVNMMHRIDAGTVKPAAGNIERVLKAAGY